MMIELLKFAFSALRDRAGGLFKKIWTYARKGWNALNELFSKGVGNLLAPDLDPVTRASVQRLRARAEAVLRERAEKEAREHAQTQTGRADVKAAKNAMAEAEAKAKAAGATEEAAKKAAASVKLPDESAVLVRMPSFGASANMRAASVIQLAAPVAIKAIVRTLANTPARRNNFEDEMAAE